MPFRTQLRQKYWHAILRTAKEIHPDYLKRPAVVFSPHQDDETLACGGTIIRKREVGADVWVVFLTDGSGSHSHLVSNVEMRTIRREEALAACRTLGVETNRVLFLDFPDGALKNSLDQAIQQVSEILNQAAPDEVFCPYRNETPPDHSATHTIVLAALRAVQRQAYVYEYPVWYWNQWPWTSLSGFQPDKGAVLKNSLNSALGLRFLMDFRTSVDIRNVLDTKRAALNQYKSQMERQLEDPRWLTLRDVAKSEFLECFTHTSEVFRGYQV